MRMRGLALRYFTGMEAFIKQQGFNFDDVLSTAGIQRRHLDRLDITLSPDQIEGLIKAAQQLTKLPHLGFEMGVRLKTTSHGVLGLGMLSCTNLGQALNMLARHFHLMNSLFTVHFHEKFHQGEFICTPTAAMPKATLNFLMELMAAAFTHEIYNLLEGNVQHPYDVYITLSQPIRLRRHAELGPVRFHFKDHSVPGVRICLPHSLLHQDLPMADIRVANACDKRCAEMTPPPDREDNEWGEYISMLLHASGNRELTLDNIAERTHISSRTLERYLKREGLSFRTLANQMRLNLAKELLESKDISISDIALQLGYNDPANFSRAFKRATGLSPLAFKNQIDDE